MTREAWRVALETVRDAVADLAPERAATVLTLALTEVMQQLPTERHSRFVEICRTSLITASQETPRGLRH